MVEVAVLGQQPDAPMGEPPRTKVGDDSWWTSHWEEDRAAIVAFLAKDWIEVAGRSVADLGW
jgi:hypothetical protein